MKRFLVLASVLLLAACGGDEHSDLRQELNTLTKGLRGHVKPLPQVKPYQPVSYTAEDLVDPFRPDRIIIAKAAKGFGGTPGPDLNRPKEPLEAFPLESIEMVGTITQGKQTYGLVKAGANLYRVKQGNYMGQNDGLVIQIPPTQIRLVEIVPDGLGGFVKRPAALGLSQ